jgi:hypothetical protein
MVCIVPQLNTVWSWLRAYIERLEPRQHFCFRRHLYLRLRNIESCFAVFGTEENQLQVRSITPSSRRLALSSRFASGGLLTMLTYVPIVTNETKFAPTTAYSGSRIRSVGDIVFPFGWARGFLESALAHRPSFIATYIVRQRRAMLSRCGFG